MSTGVSWRRRYFFGLCWDYKKFIETFGTVQAGTGVKTALTNANVNVSKIVATEIGSHGILTVYVR
jgi:hypothetical protein